ncbi:SRPBCC domain-containing protein [Corallococcus exiguus]|uniref:SRPBCC family protein n=1 Tax=Corallococcus exiguus TaxID=83462 RepID=UPI001A8D6268|nr:SRPBCC domain-containing protein [Corallococcus exiguus]MBN8467442.1 SRPBCC domain-containing protein [Corallococcus exiguus]
MTQGKIDNFVVDKDNLAVKVERSFDAPLDLVWSAWTEADLLDQWWAPKPWKAETKSMDFSEGGRRLYAMVGTQGERHWGLWNFSKITPRTSFTYRSLFCDENGNVNPATTGSTWVNSFSESKGITLVTNDIRCDSIAHLEAQIKMGFKEGYSMGLGNLEELLAHLRKTALAPGPDLLKQY